MASASQRKATRISQKLTLLKYQGDRLIGAVGQYVSEIVTAGESWTEGGDNQMEYLDLCQTIDFAADFLWERCEELSDAPAVVSANRHSRPCGEQADPIPQLETATSYRQPATSQTSTAIASNRQATQIIQPAEVIQLKPVLARIAVIEDALGFSRGNAERVAEQQKDIDQRLTEVLLKLSDSDKKNKTTFRKFKEQISEINDNHDALNQEHEARLQSLEKQLKKLNATQETIKVEMQSQTELTEQLVHVPDQLDSVKDHLDVLEAKIGKIIDNSSEKQQDIDIITRDLEDRIIVVSERIQVISEDQDQKTALLRELETKLQTFETDSERNVKDVQKQVGKGEANFRILCQMLNDRLTPLEQLRTCLNQQASTREENFKTLSQLVQEMAVMSPRLQQLELKFSRTRCGFTARTGLSRQATGDTIKRYDTPLSNVGGNFNADSGIFTAPVDGHYVTSVSLYLLENEALKVSVGYKVLGHGQSSGADVCWCLSTVKNTNVCSMGVVDMKAGDTLCLYGIVEQKRYGDILFSCFLLA